MLMLGIHPGFEPRADVTRNLKQAYQWSHERDLCPTKTFLKRDAYELFQFDFHSTSRVKFALVSLDQKVTCNSRTTVILRWSLKSNLDQRKWWVATGSKYLRKVRILAKKSVCAESFRAKNWSNPASLENQMTSSWWGAEVIFIIDNSYSCASMLQRGNNWNYLDLIG